MMVWNKPSTTDCQLVLTLPRRRCCSHEPRIDRHRRRHLTRDPCHAHARQLIARAAIRLPNHRQHRLDQWYTAAHTLGSLSLASLTDPNRPDPNLLGSFRTTMGKQGAVSVVLAGLERHPADEGVQVYGCWALGCLARSAGALQRSQLFVPRTRSLTNLVPQRTNVSSMPSTQSRASWRCCAPTRLTD